MLVGPCWQWITFQGSGSVRGRASTWPRGEKGCRNEYKTDDHRGRERHHRRSDVRTSGVRSIQGPVRHQSAVGGAAWIQNKESGGATGTERTADRRLRSATCDGVEVDCRAEADEGSTSTK